MLPEGKFQPQGSLAAFRGHVESYAASEDQQSDGWKQIRRIPGEREPFGGA